MISSRLCAGRGGWATGDGDFHDSRYRGEGTVPTFDTFKDDPMYIEPPTVAPYTSPRPIQQDPLFVRGVNFKDKRGRLRSFLYM